MTEAAAVRRMTAEEFGPWVAHETAMYAAELAEASGASLAETAARAESQLREFLPDGVGTAGVHLLRVLDDEGAPVGVLWLGPHPQRADAGWVFDVEIDEDRRGEGFGRGAMLAAERVARDAGWVALGLNVFGPNARARGLYDSLGYGVVSTTMAKPLSG
jgi:GNAT superfamily N-acetyltransferase